MNAWGSFGCTLFLLVGAAAHGASADCARAATAMEKAICATPELRQLDETLARDHSRALHALSPRGQRLLREGQRRWLAYLRGVCFTHAKAPGDADCVGELYKSRIEDMQSAALRKGAYVFSRLDYFYVRADKNSDSPAHGQTSYPRIDSPANATTAEWNALVAPTRKAAEDFCDGPMGDVDEQAFVAEVTAATIGIDSTHRFYCHGTAHSHGGVRYINYVITPRVHPLAAEDLFRRDVPWRDFLVERVTEAWKNVPEAANLSEIDRQEMLQDVVEPESWLVGSNGLTVRVSPYRGPPITTRISWSLLRPLLRVDAPVPR